MRLSALSPLYPIGGRGVPRGEHEWVYVIVAPATTREAERFIAGERKVFRKLDLDDPEVVRSRHVMCAACKLAAHAAGDLQTPCEGIPLEGAS